MKKFSFRRAGAVALAAMMSLSMMATSALAADITIGGTAGEYSGYKLLNLTTSLKGGCSHEDDAHTADCYNYNYTVNEKYRSVLQSVMPESANTDGVAGYSDEEILKYIGDLASNSDDLRVFADAVFKGIGTMEADAKGANALTNVPQGYYLIAETTRGEAPDMNSLVMLDTAGQQNITVTPKEGVPTLTKKIDEDGSLIEGTAVAYGDVVKYQLNVSIPKEMVEYENLVLKINDTLPAGVVFQDDLTVEHVGADGLVGTMPTPVVTNDGTSLTATLSFGDASAILKQTGAAHEFKVTYTVKVNEDGADVVLGSAGNVNTANLEFTANPYNAAETEKTIDDTANFFTFGLTVNKVQDATPDGAEEKVYEALTGANFELQKKNAGGSYVALFTPDFDAAKSTFEFKGLDEGEYRLVETKTPDGFASIDPIDFKIVPTIDENGELTALEVKDVTDGSTIGAVLSTGMLTTQVLNVAGNRMPITGGAGVYALYIGGALLVFIGGAAVVLKKKKSAE